MVELDKNEMHKWLWWKIGLDWKCYGEVLLLAFMPVPSFQKLFLLFESDWFSLVLAFSEDMSASFIPRLDMLQAGLNLELHGA